MLDDVEATEKTKRGKRKKNMKIENGDIRELREGETERRGT